MNNKAVTLGIFLSVIFVSCICAQNTDFPLLKGPYLGQEPPGMKPEIFAPNIFGPKDLVYANVTFAPDFTEACWTPNNGDTTQYHGGIMITQFSQGKWTVPSEVEFLDNDYSHRSPFYSYDGQRLYFQGYLRSNQGWDQEEKFYFVEKTSKGWTKPQLLDTIFNKYAVHWQFSLDRDHNLYFGGDLRGVENSGGIYFSKFVEGRYQEPVLIFGNAKYGEAVFGPVISPENDYLVFARVHPRGSTNPRIFSLYISFGKGEDDWSEPAELGEKLNMDGNQPRISPDGKYLFFVGNDSRAYWVDARIIEQFRPDH